MLRDLAKYFCKSTKGAENYKLLQSGLGLGLRIGLKLGLGLGF